MRAKKGNSLHQPKLNLPPSYKMSSNGLLASTDVCATGSPASNFFVRVGDAVVIPDPLQIVSPDGSETLSIGIANSGVAAISGASSLGVGTLVGGVSSFTVAANGDVATLGGLEVDGTIVATSGISTNAITSLGPGEVLGVGSDVNIVGSLEADSAAIVGTLQANTGAFNNITQAISVLNMSATGGINVASNMTVSGGSLLQVSGGSGTAQVFDPIYNPVSVITSAALVVNSPSTIELPSNATPTNILTVPIPAAGQNAMIFDVALNLTMEYQTASSLNQNFFLYLTPTSQGALDLTKAVPSVSYTTGLNNQVLTLTPITNKGVIEFTVQGSILRFYNTTGATVPNLYLTMVWQGGEPTSIGNLTDVNIYALVECRKGVFVAPA